MYTDNKNINIEELELLFKNSHDLNELFINKNKFTKKYIAPLYSQLKNANNDEKIKIGKLANDLKNKVNEMFDHYKDLIENRTNNLSHKLMADLCIDTANFSKGSLNPITYICNEIISFFRKYDFKIVNGNEVEQIKYNFDNLNFSEEHPGRQTSETFYINDKLMLRAHTTASTAEQLVKNNKSKDIRVISFGNVYRNDDDDASHSHQFTQIDLVWVKKGLSVGTLKWFINSLLKYLYGPNTKTRYRLSFFPFTEPSMEVDVKCPICHGKGCNLCKKTGWIEILGAGMLHQNVLKKSGINDIKTGIAAGVGIERLAMIKFGISDIRDIYTNNFAILKQFSNKGE